jgi:hypothetical protein
VTAANFLKLGEWFHRIESVFNIIFIFLHIERLQCKITPTTTLFSTAWSLSLLFKVVIQCRRTRELVIFESFLSMIAVHDFLKKKTTNSPNKQPRVKNAGQLQQHCFCFLRSIFVSNTHIVDYVQFLCSPSGRVTHVNSIPLEIRAEGENTPRYRAPLDGATPVLHHQFGSVAMARSVAAWLFIP